MSPGAAVIRVAELEGRAAAEMSKSQNAQQANLAGLQAVKAQFTAYRTAKAREISSLEGRLRRTLGLPQATTHR